MQYPWRALLTSLNRALKMEGVELHHQPVRLKVRTNRPLDDGSYAVDVLACWQPEAKVSTRSAGVSVSRVSFERQLLDAMGKARELVVAVKGGRDSRRIFSAEAPLPELGRSRGMLRRQVEDCKGYLEARFKQGRCREAQYRRQLDLLSLCEAHAMRHGAGLTTASCAAALLEHYEGDLRAASYKSGLDIMRACVKNALGGSGQIPTELIPLYRYQPQLRDIPPDPVIAERLQAIADEAERRLIYAVVGYGRRVSEIYGVDWSTLADDSMVYGIGFKNEVLGWSWIIPFGDERIGLQGFRPPRWKELGSPLRLPSAEKLDAIKRHCSGLSRLIRRRLGCTATDLRHRWGAQAILNPRNGQANLMLIAKALHTSTAMLEKAYTKELDLIGVNEVRRHT